MREVIFLIQYRFYFIFKKYFKFKIPMNTKKEEVINIFFKISRNNNLIIQIYMRKF